MRSQNENLTKLVSGTSTELAPHNISIVVTILMVLTTILSLPVYAAASSCNSYWFAQTGYCVTAPTNPTWMSTRNSVTMNWRLDQLAEEPNVTRIYRGNTLLKEFPVKAQKDPSALDHFNDLFTYSEDGLQPNRSYDYKLCSVYAFADVCGEPIIATTKTES